MNNKENLKSKITSLLDEFEGENINRVLEEIHIELNKVINKYLGKHECYDTDFPIEFKNDFGNWKIHSNGNCFIQPITPIKSINITITINKDGEITTTD